MCTNECACVCVGRLGCAQPVPTGIPHWTNQGSKQGAASKASRKAVPAAIVFFWLPFQTIQKGILKKRHTQMPVKQTWTWRPRATSCQEQSLTLARSAPRSQHRVWETVLASSCAHLSTHACIGGLDFSGVGVVQTRFVRRIWFFAEFLTHASTGKHGNNPACSRIARYTGQV